MIKIEAKNCGVKSFQGFYGGTQKLVAWCGGRWVFYAHKQFPTVRVSQWMSWWEEAAQLYETLTSVPQYLESDPNFGQRKVIAISPHQFWGLGNGRRVEISRSAFDSELMNGSLDTKDKHGIIFYELGRQAGYLYDFYNYAEYTDESWRRGFPLYVECLCRTQVGGIDLSATRWTNRVLEKWENCSLNYLDIFGPKHFEWNRCGFDLGILMGAFLLELHEQLGIDFMVKFIGEIRKMPAAPDSALAAAGKVQKAAVAAAGRDLNEFFVDRWKWPGIF